jgi:CheY-like chemotaxis protein
VAEELSKLRPPPLLIAVTGYADQYPEAQARAAGFDFYLVKPADPFVIEAPDPRPQEPGLRARLTIPVRSEVVAAAQNRWISATELRPAGPFPPLGSL